MAAHTEAALTREALIWLLVQKIAVAEGKPITLPVEEKNAGRSYVLTLVRDVIYTVDGKGLHPEAKPRPST
jgi:hypothetical protein